MEFYNRLVWDLFWLSSIGRPVGMGGVEPIPLAEIIVQFEVHAIPQEERVEILELIKSMDLKFREFFQRQQERKLKKADDAAKSPRRRN